MGQNLLVQYSRSKFKQHNGTTTINNAMAPPPPQLVSTNLVDENNSGGYYNTNNNGFKRNKNPANTYSTNYVDQQTNMGCINDGMPASSSNIKNNRNNVNKMTTLKYQQQVNSVTSQSKPLSSTSGGGSRSLSIENATNRNKQNVNLMKKASGGGGVATTQITKIQIIIIRRREIIK